MSETTTTHYSNKASILAELWMNYRNDEDFTDFIEYNDLGLPLAYAVAEGIIESSDKARKFIEETFAIFIDGLGIEDEGFEDLNEVLANALDEDTPDLDTKLD